MVTVACSFYGWEFKLQYHKWPPGPFGSKPELSVCDSSLSSWPLTWFLSSELRVPRPATFFSSCNIYRKLEFCFRKMNHKIELWVQPSEPAWFDNRQHLTALALCEENVQLQLVKAAICLFRWRLGTGPGQKKALPSMRSCSRFWRYSNGSLFYCLSFSEGSCRPEAWRSLRREEAWAI